jgi:hypothetical protein
MTQTDPSPPAANDNSFRNAGTSGKAEKYSYRSFRRGDWVQIRSLEEIRATLDAEGRLDGLPFMPEQTPYCGQRFQIYRRADWVFLDHHFFVVRLKNTVLLDDLRCDGSAHGGCQMNCLMFWKEAWLRPAVPPTEEEKRLAAVPLISLTPVLASNPPTIAAISSEIGSAAKTSEKFSCQATELARIGHRLSGWDPRQYIWDLLNRERSIGDVLDLLLRQARDKLKRMLSGKNQMVPTCKASKPSGVALNLQPGEWVEVKSVAEINETLSSDNRLRGLGFSPDMIPFCGKRLRVKRRVERMILEWTGEMKQLRDTVALETVHCDGSSCWACPRNCFFLWREDWLKRVEQPANSPE